MYDPGAYEFDKVDHHARIRSGGMLYRITSIHYNKIEEVLSGFACASRSQRGRFNLSHQTTSYCATNVLAAISEVLYHMYRDLLEKIGRGATPLEVMACQSRFSALAIMEVKGIDDLVNIGAEQTGFVYGISVCGTAAVHPDQFYEMYDRLQQKVRSEDHRGIVYPSARHREGDCLALFRNESAAIEPLTYATVNIELCLIREAHDFTAPPARCNPYKDLVHPTMGFYQVLDPAALESARAAGQLNPHALPASAYVDFVRRRYTTYPLHAAVPRVPMP